MRILALRFQNLNSLRGPFDLDFATGPLGRAGLFAITGPTGAGKSTVLDAISVALYGRTPRLEGAAVADLMSRHTGECWAEVDFEVPTGRYRSRWSLRRARGRADGRLQAFAMELADLGGPEPRLIEDRARDVHERVAELTGLDFERFTRSILLAQGSFAAFLAAKANDRADLLEKLTGTEIYSRLSVAAFERARDEEQKLAQLELRRDSLNLLPAAELQALETHLTELNAQVAAGQATLRTLESWQAWHQALLNLEQALVAAQAELAAVEQARTGHQTDLARLALARRTQPLRADWQALDASRRRLRDLEAELQALADSVPELDRQATAAETAQGEAAGLLDTTRLAAAARQPQLDDAIRLDEVVRAETQTLESRRRTAAEATAAADTSRQRAALGQTRVTEMQARLESADLYLREHAADAALESALPVLDERLGAVRTARLACRRAEEAAVASRTQRTRLTGAARRAQRLLAEARTALEQAATAVTAAAARLAEAGAGRTLADWETDARRHEERRAALQCLLAIGQRYLEARTAADTARREGDQAAETATAAAARDAEHTDALAAEERILQALQEKRQLELLVARYEDARTALKPDQPCPLCGAREHPYADHGAPAAKGTEQAIRDQRRRVDATRHERDADAAALAAARATGDQLRRQAAAETARAEQATVEWRGLAPGLGLDLTPERTPELGPLLEQAEHAAAEARRQATAWRELAAAVEASRDEQVGHERAVAKLELAATAAAAEQAQAEADTTRLDQDAETRRQERLAAESALAATCTAVGEDVPAPGAEAALAKRLAARREGFAAVTGERARTGTELAAATAELAAARQQGQAAASATAMAETAATAQAERLAAVQAQRRAVLGDDDPARVRRELVERVARQEAALRQAREAQAQARTRLQARLELLGSRQAELATTRTAEAQATAELAARLRAGGFADEPAYRAALLPPDDQERLEALEKELDTRDVQARTRLRDTEARRTAEQARALTERPAAEVTAELEIQRAAADALSRQAGEAQATLRQQRKLGEQQRELVRQVEAQARETRRWDTLNDLIGAADGRKFRRFAQGLTLDVLVRLANQHLQTFSDRYWLERSPGEDGLDLRVLDSYQADVARPTGTLSGGETFLVSLALALGLSGLASRRARIDSLFLDEGFGSLDAEALEIALAALAALNAGGKVIGVISHVDLVKERIPAQIQVSRQGHGVSSLEVVG